MFSFFVAFLFIQYSLVGSFTVNTISQGRRFLCPTTLLLTFDSTDLISPTLGCLYKLNEVSGSNSVEESIPTYAAEQMNLDEEVELSDQKLRCSDLASIMGMGPSFLLEGILTDTVCREWISVCDSLSFGNYREGKSDHGAVKIVVSDNTVNNLAAMLQPYIDMAAINERAANENLQKICNPLVFNGLNRRWRIYRYESDSQQNFAPHIDVGFPPSGAQDKELIWDTSDGATISRLSALFYLNDDFRGGATSFLEEAEDNNGISKLVKSFSVLPVTGSCLVFPQGVGEALDVPWHEGSPVVSGNPKYVIRTDILFTRKKSNITKHASTST